MTKKIYKLGAWAIIAVGVASITAGVFQRTKTIEVEKIDATRNNVNAAIEPMLTSQIVTSRVKAKKIDLSSVDTVVLFEEVNAVTVGSVISELDKLCGTKSDSPVYLLLDSPGGSVLDGVKLISAIESCQRPVHTVNVGLSASMAAMIHSYGARRLVTPRSILMYHNASGQLQGEFPKMLSRLTTIGQVVTKMEMNVAKRSGMKLEDYRRRATDELWVDSDQATQQGFADEIVYVSNIPMPQVFDIKNKTKAIYPKSGFNITW